MNAKSFIAIEECVYLVLEREIAVHLVGVKGGEHEAAAVPFKAIANLAEDIIGDTLIEYCSGVEEVLSARLLLLFLVLLILILGRLRLVVLLFVVRGLVGLLIL